MLMRSLIVASTMITASPRFLTTSRAVARSSTVCAAAGAAPAAIASSNINPGSRMFSPVRTSNFGLQTSNSPASLFPRRLDLDEHRPDAAPDFEDDRRGLARFDVGHARLEHVDIGDGLAVDRQNQIAAVEPSERRPAAHGHGLDEHALRVGDARILAIRLGDIARPELEH